MNGGVLELKLLHRVMLILALFVTATICYIAGNATGTTTFIVLGVAVEILFWLQIIPSKKTIRSS